MVIYLIRHARPDDHDGICYGRRDIPVSAVATQRALGSLRRGIPADVLRHAPIFSSPLQRCAALARAIAAGRPVTLMPALLELDFGSWEGRRWEDIARRELDCWAADLWRYAPGKGESVARAARRWECWVKELANSAGPAVIAVSHAGLIRVAHAVASSGDLSCLSMQVDFGAVYPLDVAALHADAHARESALL
jgi:alpha-ribazole phosphatase